MAESHITAFVTPVAPPTDRSGRDGIAQARRQREPPQRRRPPQPPARDEGNDDDRTVGTRLDVTA